MVPFDPENLSPCEVPALDVFDHDPVDWDAWLTPEAILDETNPSQLLLQHIPQLDPERSEDSLPSDESLRMVQSLDSKKRAYERAHDDKYPNTKSRRTCLCEMQKYRRSSSLEHRNEQLKSPEPTSALGSAGISQKTFLTSPDFELLKVQDIEREASHNNRPISNWDHADQYIDCIQKICQIATGETLSQQQARDVKNCCDDLVTNLQSKGLIATSKSLLVDCHLYALPSLDSYDLNSSLTACVAYLRYLNSVAGSTSKPGHIQRRLAQIWIYIHFENYVNDLQKCETDGLPLNRRGRAISTIARDSILQATHESQFMPQKADRGFLSDQCRWGERWWKVATCMGLGVVLLASEDLANQIGRRTAFQNKMVDTLAIYVLNRYPALISLYRSFEPMTVGLMLGDTAFPRDKLNTLQEALVGDEAFLSYKQERWLIPNLESLSRLAATHLVIIQRSQAG
ncbi:hypothetical protein N7492_009713 [Penicillium capsulatum]|uniref:Uncharacterized protein n=1 Tax=Penicillium capsulatum TaxID=69766 RepID=A0A9W9HLT1_9EURO|nr:hypothetical protein N7492_009713 [Penicillium capsulatum]KAJ6114207.1 hypothetical protein N7512_007652 [Penicillium capsulatum]